MLIKLSLIAGAVLVAAGLYGLFIPRLTSDDGAVLIAGAVLLGAGVMAATRKG